MPLPARRELRRLPKHLFPSHAARGGDDHRGAAGYDPTNPIRASEHHVRVAVGRDYQDVAPTRGTYPERAQQRMEVHVTTRVLSEAAS